MKKILAMLCVFLLAVPVVLADESDDATRRYEVAQARVDVLAAERLVAMDTVLEELQDLTTDDELAEADALRDNFAELAELVSTFTSRAGLREGVEDLRESIQAFREEVQPLLETYDVDTEALKEEIGERVESSEDVTETRATLSAVAEDLLQDKYDLHLSRMQRILEKVQEMHPDADLTDLTAMVDEFSAYDLESAIASGNPEDIKEATFELRSMFEEFRATLKDTLGEPEGTPAVDRFRLGKAQRALNKMEATINDLGSLGFDTSELSSLHETAQSSFDDVESAIDAEDDKETVKELADAFREDAQDFLTSLRDLVGLEDDHVIEVEETVEEL